MTYTGECPGVPQLVGRHTRHTHNMSTGGHKVSVMTPNRFPMFFMAPASPPPAQVGAALEAMTATGVPTLTLAGDKYEVLYGYERACGRSVLVMVRRRANAADDTDIAVFGEVVEPGVLWLDGGPTDALHEAMLSGVPGEVVTFDADLGNHEYTDIVQRQRRRLSESEMSELVGVDYRLPVGTPIRPFIRREWGEDVPGPVHECDTCMWR